MLLAIEAASDPVIRLTALFAALTNVVQAVVALLLIVAAICLPFSRARSIEALKFAGLVLAIWILGPVALGAILKLLKLILSPWLVAIGAIASLAAYLIRQRQQRRHQPQPELRGAERQPGVPPNIHVD